MAQHKKLIEVSLPLEAINAESAREKSIRHGHPSTLHLWWARRPLAAARAVAALPVLAEYCLPLVRVGGRFIALKGPDADAECAAAASALKKLGGAWRETRPFTLPDSSERRLVVCEKISQTPTAYPRNGGKIAKKPL